MENLEVNSKLDLTVNKDDLMDMLIDQQLTVLETQLKEVRDEKTAIQEKIDASEKKREEVMNKKLIKLLPKELQGLTPESIHHQHYHNSTVNYNFKGFHVSIHGVNTNEAKPKEETKLEDEVSALYRKECAIASEINKIEKSGKRIKAKMLKEFLNNSEEGKSILKLMNSSQVKLLGS